MKKLWVLLLFLPNVYTASFKWTPPPAESTQIVYDNRLLTNDGQASTSNLGCFLCTQLLTATKHRVGLSQNQLKNSLYEKCRLLPAVFKENCFTFVETSLPEIYFSLNYDFSTKDICYRLNLCDENQPMPVKITSKKFTPLSTTVRQTTPSTTTTTRLTTTTMPPKTASTTTTTTTTSTTTPVPRIVPPSSLKPRSRDKVGKKNSIFPIDEEEEIEVNFGDNKQSVCEFCEKILENAKNYAVDTKADISLFVNNACAKLPKGDISDKCYQLADKKIADLAKFVDQQVVEALWCAEVNEC